MVAAMTPIDTKTRHLLKDPKKRRAWVIFQLNTSSRTLADVAREAGVDRRTLYHAFSRPYPRMERFIARSVGLEPQQLFSERYDRDGLPFRGAGIQKDRCHGGKPTTRKIARNTQSVGAA